MGRLIELTPFFVVLALTALVDNSAEPHASAIVISVVCVVCVGLPQILEY